MEEEANGYTERNSSKNNQGAKKERGHCCHAPGVGANGWRKRQIENACACVDPAGQCRPGGNMNPGAVQAHNHVLSR